MEEWTVWDNQPNSETAICKDALSIVNGVTGLGGICVLEPVEGVCKEGPVR